jgi:hypothetical protein
LKGVEKWSVGGKGVRESNGRGEQKKVSILTAGIY